MMQKVIRFLLIFLIAAPGFSFLSPDKEKINWISIAELNDLYSKAPKPIFLDVYTNWCGWCKEMDRTTFTNQKLVKYINANYYAVKLNAESPEEMDFNNKKYSYNAQRRSNELAEFLLYGQMQYPTTVFLSSIDAKPAPLPGYVTAKDMEAPLKYFGGGFYKTTSFVDYNKSMKKEW